MSAEIQSFEEDVLEKSRTTPVVVDFWAPWCGPCRVLGPVLEKLAQEQNGRWELVKVNTDEHPELSVRYGVRGIPAVKLFIDGRVADEFTGALPEHAVRSWLDTVIPSESGQSLVEASTRFSRGDQAAARPLLERVLVSDPENAIARVLLAATNVWDEPKSSAASVDGTEITDPTLLQVADSVRDVATALQWDADDLPEGRGREKFAEAVAALRDRDFDTAIERIIDVLLTDRLYGDDRARRLGVAIFTLLGEEHEVSTRHRRNFDMALY